MMISHIHDFSYLLANNELEALVLESNLIKRYQPFYNILLKDDHDYPYLKITMNELYPRALKAYRIGADVDEGAKVLRTLSSWRFVPGTALYTRFSDEDMPESVSRISARSVPVLIFIYTRYIGLSRRRISSGLSQSDAVGV